MVNPRKTAVATTGLLAVLATVTFTATASAGQPQLLPAAQAEALVASTPTVQSGSVTRKVSAQEALAAAASPGATVSLAPGYSLTQAVGLAPEPAPAGAVPSPVVRPIGAAVNYVGCNANAAWHQWGTWPYEQKITDTTYWCAVYGDHITYTSSSVTATGTFCGTSWTTSQLISGGIGYSWFVMRSSAGWACPTVIPWVTLHPSHYEDVSRNAWGSTAEIGSG